MKVSVEGDVAQSTFFVLVDVGDVGESYNLLQIIFRTTGGCCASSERFEQKPKLEQFVDVG
jgi:hypothetical protein